MTKPAPSPDDKTVRGALQRALTDRGLEPQDDWVTVRMVRWPREWLYTVIITHQPARVALSEILPHYGSIARENAVLGIWVIDESQARALCERSWQGEPGLV
jgi:hypothetical protein